MGVEAFIAKETTNASKVSLLVLNEKRKRAQKMVEEERQSMT